MVNGLAGSGKRHGVILCPESALHDVYLACLVSHQWCGMILSSIFDVSLLVNGAFTTQFWLLSSPYV